MEPKTLIFFKSLGLWTYQWFSTGAILHPTGHLAMLLQLGQHYQHLVSRGQGCC